MYHELIPKVKSVKAEGKSTSSCLGGNFTGSDSTSPKTGRPARRTAEIPSLVIVSRAGDKSDILYRPSQPALIPTWSMRAHLTTGTMVLLGYGTGRPGKGSKLVLLSERQIENPPFSMPFFM